MDISLKAYEYISHGITSFKELKGFLNVKSNELDKILKNLIAEEKIVSEGNSYYALMQGRININPRGYGFVSVEGFDKDFYIPAEFINGAFEKDLCLIYPFDNSGRSISAKVYKVIDRYHKYVIGALKKKSKKNKDLYYVRSNMKDFDCILNIDYAYLNGAKPGDIVYAKITKYGINTIYGQIERIIGKPNDKGIEISEIALEFGFEDKFSDETIKELENIPDEVLDEQLVGRTDYTNRNIITIDGVDSKDFDDAVDLEILDNGNYLLGVYIADVADYVKQGMGLDKDALKKGTSVYLADRVIPMLPKKLSNGICSLNEGVIRLVLACVMEIDLDGNLINYDIKEGYIKSRHRMTYDDVNLILKGDEALINKYNDIYDMLKNMEKLSNILRNRRHNNGGIEFDVDEFKFDLNEDGSPKSVSLRSRDNAEKLIEDFMLEANQTIAYHLNISNLPCEYRIHENPDQDKLKDVFGIIRNMGVSVPALKNDIHPKQLQSILEKIKDLPTSQILNNMLLRSMMKAKYDPQCLGHYGLGMRYYCHFTSPIRRYPDLMVHRIIKRLIIHPNNFEADLAFFEAILGDISLNNSNQERKSIDCERKVNDMLSAWYMSNMPKDEVYEGIITSITNFGMYVTLENGIEGLLAYRNMDGYFDADPGNLSASSDYGVTYKLGDKVKVMVFSASKLTSKIDFVLEEDYYSYMSDEEVF